MALKGCDVQEHNVLKPTGNVKKETCTKALTNLYCFFPNWVSCIIHSKKKKKMRGKKKLWSFKIEGTGYINISKNNNKNDTKYFLCQTIL